MTEISISGNMSEHERNLHYVSKQLIIVDNPSVSCLKYKNLLD